MYEGITKGRTDKVNRIFEPRMLKRTVMIDIIKPTNKLENTTNTKSNNVFISKSKTFQDVKKLAYDRLKVANRHIK
jgi:hypothetical protein|tara:strand:- start:1644 stop:1871 length:228 start_codon:yes stop_codon:yes gene_type:complete